jgi:hypothetical protein
MEGKPHHIVNREPGERKFNTLKANELLKSKVDCDIVELMIMCYVPRRPEWE